MSYQVLARKWRPQNFKQMVGQEHVLRALMNALDSDRLHHAYLFTGTRGVGKTTIARILAKCLNCETGVTSTPCGECNSCQEITTGNFLDLIEVDAASRTKVEDTRELLENVQYAPTRARFKVYLIDEVHMLTGHSFNALLKTLEEPPPHVKFLFATTDPQKLPATILSRCLQFNLKRMPVDMITGHLKYLLEEESINFEEASLKLLGRAADGSMRDALSLLDQAIAFSGTELTENSVRDMLGTISHEPLIDLLDLILQGKGATLLERVEDLSSVTPDFDATTDALISLLHQLAVQQVVPDAINDEDSIRNLANRMSKEEVQLFYQIALQGRNDLTLSPDPRSGFEMILLRMMSFRPLREGMQLETSSAVDNTSKKKTTKLEIPETSTSNQATPEPITKTTDAIDKPAVSVHTKVDIPDAISEATITKPNNSDARDVAPPWEEIPPELEAGYTSTPTQSVKPQAIKETKAEDTDNESQVSTSLVDLLLAEDDVSELEHADDDTVKQVAEVDTNQPWYAVVPQLNLSGRANELIKHCVLEKEEKGIITLILNKDREDLLADSTKQEIHNAVVNFYGDNAGFELKVAETKTVVTDDKENETPAQRTDRKVSETQQLAQKNIESDPFVLGLKDRFGAQVVPGSVKAKQILE